MVDASQVVEYIFFFWICVTVPVQILIVTSIIRKFSQFKMNKSFFLFYTVNTFVDFINQFCMAFGVLFPAWGLFIPIYLKLGSASGKYLLMGSLWTRVSQGIACLLIALNRCSAVIWPFNYERIWSNPVIYASIFFQIFSGLPFAVFAAFKDYEWVTNATTAEQYDISQPDVRIIFDRINQVQILKIIWSKDADSKLVYSVGFIIEVENVPAITHTNKYEHSSLQRKSVNNQLFRMAASVCTIEILFTLFMLIVVTMPIHPNLFYALYNSLSILYSTLSPYILLICSSYARRLVKETYGEFFKGIKGFLETTDVTRRPSVSPSTEVEMPTLSTMRSSLHR
ncbi:hypothetical protein FO519_000074 [Halicephalobus sp. NKZ332]|nr:hypothetical protein FO519_000074 [Halicephalobus sp. NKZ332]